MKLRYFFKVNAKGDPIPGSNIRKSSKPMKGRWVEILDPCCVTILPIHCECNDFRYWVQIDGRGHPVDYSLIKRKHRPENEVSRYIEVGGIECCV